MNKKLSVCITAFNNHEVTAKHVEHSMLSTRVPDEIIVVNDHGTPDLKDMLKKLDKKCPIHYAYITDDILWNYTGARNCAFWISTGDYITIEDNDQIPHPTFYEKAIDLLEEKSDIGRVCAFERDKIWKKDFLNKPREEWEIVGKRTYHRDTQMLRRETYIKLKGCDERFAGAYAWACTDWRRRLDRAGIDFGQVGMFTAIIDGDTEDLIRRKSYRNYQFAREKDGHIQGPKGVLNFNFEYEKL